MSESGRKQQGESFCNLEYLLVNLGRNQAAAERLIQIFLDNAPMLCRRLDEAAIGSNLPALKDVLHDIRSSCVLFSGQRCADQAREIENIVREKLSEAPGSNSRVDWRPMVAPLSECIQCMEAELAAYLAERKS